MWKIRIRKRIVMLALVILIFAIVLRAYSGSNPPGSGIATSPGSYKVPNGSFKQIQDLPFRPYNATGIASNSTMVFDVLGVEDRQPPAGVVFNVTTTGAVTARFIGSQPIVICASCTKSYSSSVEKISYSGAGTDVLTIIWGPGRIFASEPQSVLFADDFLYPNVLASTQWVIDRYTSQSSDPGVWTSSGYLNFRGFGFSRSENIHVLNPSFVAGSPVDNTIIKRKLTAAGVQFSYKASNDANIKVGIAPLFTTGVFPGNTPYGTPNKDDSNACTDSTNAADNIGLDYMVMDDSGVVTLVSCGDGATSRIVLETVDPRLYTVFTVETRAISCSTCLDNQMDGSSWVWGRVYQLDAKGAIIASTDKNVNVTGGPPGSNKVAPLANTNYVFINLQSSTFSGVAKVDYVNLQNFGSPVCLNVPGGFLCTRFPLIPKSPFATASFVDTFAWIANFIGGGDPQIGAIFLFFLAILGGVGTILLFTRSILLSSEMAMLILGFFTYAGFLPSWVLFPVILFAAVLVVMIVQKMMGGGGLNGGGGSEE